MIKTSRIGLAAFAFVLAASTAKADITTTWTFETSQPSVTGQAAGPYAAEVGVGNASGMHASASTIYSTPAGNGSTHSFSSNTWTVGDYYQYSISTTGNQNVMLSWDQTSSNTGPKDFALEYSENGGSYTQFSTYSVLANASPNPAWNATTYSSLYTMTADLSSISALNNQTLISIEFVDLDTTSANNGTVATAGTDRMDNVTISALSEGAAVPEPSSLLLLTVSGIGLCRRLRNRFLAV